MQDALNTQMSTQKKINRPSDDPVIAIRALRLRSDVTEITQYYAKNIPDAKSWLEVTEGALKNVSEVITDMVKQCTKGSNGDLTSDDRAIVLESLKALRDEVYSTGDADYAGRYVFTGYRTDTSLKFGEATNQQYSITEQLDSSKIKDITYVNTSDLSGLNEANYDTLTATEQTISSSQVHRIQLAYSSLDGETPKLTDADGNALTYDGTNPIVVETAHSYDSPSPYAQIGDDANTNKAIFIQETGELLLGENAYNQMMGIKDDPTTSDKNEGEIRITYEKTEWAKGDLRPEHYFACSTDSDDADKKIDYNQNYLTTGSEKQVMEYDVGFNQTIRVNSTADECFKHEVGRTTDDLIQSLEDVTTMEDVVATLKKLQKSATDPADKEKIQAKLDAANKAYTMLKDKIQKLFEAGITSMQGYLDDTTLAITNCGTRSKKLTLIENRMQTQKTTFETLKSENEDADMTEVAIQLKSAELTYEAALMASGKVLKTTLLDFI